MRNRSYFIVRTQKSQGRAPSTKWCRINISNASGMNAYRPNYLLGSLLEENGLISSLGQPAFILKFGRISNDLSSSFHHSLYTRFNINPLNLYKSAQNRSSAMFGAYGIQYLILLCQFLFVNGGVNSAASNDLIVDFHCHCGLPDLIIMVQWMKFRYTDGVDGRPCFATWDFAAIDNNDDCYWIYSHLFIIIFKEKNEQIYCNLYDVRSQIHCWQRIV